MAQRLWHSWQHGALICTMVFFGALLGAICVAIPAYILLALVGTDAQLTVQIVELLGIIWVPLGVGILARKTSFDAFKPERSGA